MALSLIVIPSSALILPAVAIGEDDQIHDLRRMVARAMEHLDGGAQTVVVASDPSGFDGARFIRPPDGIVHLGGLGMPGERTPVRAWEADGIPMTTAHPGPDLSVLAVLAGRHTSDAPVLIGLNPVPRHANAEAMRVAELLARRATAEPIAVICAGDLSAGHGPKPPRPQVNPGDAATVDQAIAEMLVNPHMLANPDILSRADTTSARGIPSILVAAHLSQLTGLGEPTITRTQVAGVGGVIATYGGMPDTTTRLGAPHATPGEPQ